MAFMDMNMNIIASPLVGAVIGYITNAVAIKMLFRPARPVYIGKCRLPFTPGLIPKEKARLAASIGDVVGADLLSEDAIRNALTGEEMLEKLRAALTEALQKGAASEKTVAECAASALGGEIAAQGIKDAKAQLAGFLAARLIEADLGQTAANSITEGIRKKTPGGIADFLSNVMDGRLKQNAAGQIQSAVNGYVERHAGEIMQGVVEREADKLLCARVCDLAGAHTEKLPEAVEKLIGLYRQAIGAGLERALHALDISGIVRHQIESIDDGDLEKMIFAVVDKELNAIVYLGALLGFLMGFVNLLFQ